MKSNTQKDYWITCKICGQQFEDREFAIEHVYKNHTKQLIEKMIVEKSLE